MIQAWIIGVHHVPFDVYMAAKGEPYEKGNFVVRGDDAPPVIMTREQFHEEYEWVSSAQDAQEEDAFGRRLATT